MATYQLNVMFHGPFIFVVYSDRIEVLSPDIPDHDIGAGTWHKETPCNNGTYTLKGIAAQQIPLQDPNTQTFVILDTKKLPKMKVPKNADYQFVLKPLPSSMTALGLLTPQQPTLFTGNDVGNINVPPKIGSSHLFSYIMDEKDKPELNSFPWQAETKQVGNLVVTNLHIFSESPFDLGDLHPSKDFDLMVQMLSGLSLALANPFPKIKFDLTPNLKGIGIDDDEQGGLRGLPSSNAAIFLVPPRICDSASLVVTNAT